MSRCAKKRHFDYLLIIDVACELSVKERTWKRICFRELCRCGIEMKEGSKRGGGTKRREKKSECINLCTCVSCSALLWSTLLWFEWFEKRKWKPFTWMACALNVETSNATHERVFETHTHAYICIRVHISLESKRQAIDFDILTKVRESVSTRIHTHSHAFYILVSVCVSTKRC